MIIKTNSLNEIYQIIMDNIFIKDKTIIIVNNEGFINLVTESVIKYIKEENLNDIEKIIIRKYSKHCEIGNITLMCLIDSSLIRGLRAKNIIVYNYEKLNKDDIDNIITGTMCPLKD